MKARNVKGLRADLPLADAAQRIVAVRLAELCGLAERAQDPARVAELHDTRIAAKRLRYVLEITASCFGPYAGTALRRAKDVQDLLGEVHDCDVMLPRLDGLRTQVRERDAAWLVGTARRADPPHAEAYRGLERLAVELTARRARLFHDWLELWRDLQRKGFRARLEHAIGERPVTERAPSLDGAGTV
ncbi:MAG: CHAD domain-containing protein [Actinobacteria bacterium]|nr:MAG: CHAD domain-containing protein [Actinomycetota bacterium]